MAEAGHGPIFLDTSRRQAVPTSIKDSLYIPQLSDSEVPRTESDGRLARPYDGQSCRT